MNAQMVGTNAYLKGTNVEIGIAGDGGYEGVKTSISPPPAGMHVRTNGISGTELFGFVANPQKNSWETFDGDFFTPGSPENGWGIEIGTTGTSFGNNAAFLNEIPGAITNWAHHFNCYSITWEGNTPNNNLHVKINYLLEKNDLYYTTSVSITNNTAAAIPNIYYYRNLDPDNNVMLNNNYKTQNTIVNQPYTSTCNIAHVSAIQTTPWKSYVGFAAVGANWRASYGGFENRDASDLWKGAGYMQTVDSTTTSDNAISLAYRIQNLMPGATETFKFVVILSDSASSNAINNLTYLSYPGSANAPIASCTPYNDTVKICSGIPTTLRIEGGNVNNFSWAWSPATGMSSSTGPIVSTNPATTTTYTVTGTPLNSCVSAVNIIFVVQVKPTPIVLVNSPTICNGHTALLNASGAASYSWGLQEVGNSINVSPTTTTSYTVTGTTDGCVGTSVSKVTVDSVHPVSYNHSICDGSSYVFGGSNLTTTGVYKDTVASISGCDSIITLNLNVIPKPIISITPAITITQDSSTRLTANGGSTYNWSPSVGLDITAGNTVMATPLTTTTYCVMVTNNTGCSDNACVTITVTDPEEINPCKNLLSNLTIPNAFSPNGDSNNDEFCLQGWGTCIEKFALNIHDRWGKKVFESNSPDFCWDGRFRGQPLDAGVFVYIIKIKLFDQSTKIEKTGTISLIK